MTGRAANQRRRVRRALAALLGLVASAAVGCGGRRAESSVGISCPDGTKLRTGRAWQPQTRAEWCVRPDGVKHGPFLSRWISGQPYWRGKVLDGKEDGLWREYASNGRLVSEGTFRQGREHGDWKFFSAYSGERVLTASYDDGAVLTLDGLPPEHLRFLVDECDAYAAALRAHADRLGEAAATPCLRHYYRHLAGLARLSRRDAASRRLAEALCEGGIEGFERDVAAGDECEDVPEPRPSMTME